MFASRLVGSRKKVCRFLDSEWPQAFSSTGAAIRRRAMDTGDAAAAAASKQADGNPAAEEKAGILQGLAGAGCGGERQNFLLVWSQGS